MSRMFAYQVTLSVKSPRGLVGTPELPPSAVQFVIVAQFLEQAAELAMGEAYKRVLSPNVDARVVAIQEMGEVGAAASPLQIAPGVPGLRS